MSRRPGAKGDAPQKNKAQAASLARRMAGKKGQTTQLQVEVNNEEEWEKLLSREGLIVVDVYSEWSGPCVGMIGNLKKAKLELGGDSLHLAIAKSDEIEALARFRNKSEPTWLFIAGEQLVTLIFGANAPKLLKMIDQEVKQEIRVLKGETWRRSAPLNELCDEEKERIEAAAKLKLEAARIETERIAKEIEERRQRMYNQMAEHLCYETVAICFPHTMHPEIGCVMTTELDLFWRSQMMYVSHQQKMTITKEIFDEVFLKEGVEASDDLMEDLSLGPSLVLLLKCQIIVAHGQEGEKFPGDIEKQICEALNMVKLGSDQDVVVPDPESLPAKYPYIKKIKGEEEEGEEGEEDQPEEVTSVPGCWTPASYIAKCAAVRYFFPARAEKVMTPEEPPVPPKVVIAFDVSKHKECFDLAEEYEDQVLNFGYFSSVDPETAEHLCATPEQYAKLPQVDTNKLVFVLKKFRSEPLLSFAGLGAVYVSPDEIVGTAEANLFFPPGVEPKFRRLEEAELAQKIYEPEEDAEEKVVEEKGSEEEENEEEEEGEDDAEQNEEDLMALLGLPME